MVLEQTNSTDVHDAHTGFPFYAKSSNARNDKEDISHLYFVPDNPKPLEEEGLKVTSIRTYELGEELQENELAFFMYKWPETEKIVASFPNPENKTISTKYFVIENDIQLPTLLVDALSLNYSKLKSGCYPIMVKNFAY